MKKDVVVGLGEIGNPIFKILSKHHNVIGYDTDKTLMKKSYNKKFQDYPTSFLHVAIPVTGIFEKNIKNLYKKFLPECIVIHSTISPGTTEKLQKQFEIPIIFSATR